MIIQTATVNPPSTPAFFPTEEKAISLPETQNTHAFSSQEIGINFAGTSQVIQSAQSVFTKFLILKSLQEAEAWVKTLPSGKLIQYYRKKEYYTCSFISIRSDCTIRAYIITANERAKKPTRMLFSKICPMEGKCFSHYQEPFEKIILYADLTTVFSYQKKEYRLAQQITNCTEFVRIEDTKTKKIHQISLRTFCSCLDLVFTADFLELVPRNALVVRQNALVVPQNALVVPQNDLG
ncbi:MAG: hypothetical protein WCF19_03955 [Chlamydiales bacterium]